MTAQTKQDKLLMHPRRSEVAEVAQYLVEMGEAEEGQDGWYMTFDHKVDQLLEIINSEVLSAVDNVLNMLDAEIGMVDDDNAISGKRLRKNMQAHGESIKNRYKL